MKKCSFCGKEYSDDASICVIDREPLISVVAASTPPPPLPDSARLSSAKLHLDVSVGAAVGSFLAWIMWTSDWQQQLLGYEILWSASVIIGLWGAIDAIRFAPLKSSTTASALLLSAVLLCIFHLLSLMLFYAFMSELTGRWERWY